MEIRRLFCFPFFIRYFGSVFIANTMSRLRVGSESNLLYSSASNIPQSQSNLLQSMPLLYIQIQVFSYLQQSRPQNAVSLRGIMLPRYHHPLSPTQFKHTKSNPGLPNQHPRDMRSYRHSVCHPDIFHTAASSSLDILKLA